jgi:peptidoglycan hydrolase CwlO-like protein
MSSRARRVFAVLLACLIVAGSTVASFASLSSRLSAAQRELSTLTHRIQAQEAQARTLHDNVVVLDGQIAQATARAAQIADELATTRSDISAATAEAGRLQRRIDGVARSLFMQGAGSPQGAVLGSLLSSTSFADFQDRLAYATAIGNASQDMAVKVANAKAALAVQAAQLRSLRDEQQRLLARLASARTAAATDLAAERAALAGLAQTKTRIVSLIGTLHKRIRAQELAAVGTAFQGSGHVTYGTWAGLFLRTMGVSGCQANRVAIVSWQYAEFTQAAWNPLATTLPMPGSTTFNASNVQNYPSLGEGLAATKATIDQGLGSFGYGAIVAALGRCAPAITTASAINASSWCAGCAGGTYVVGDVPKVEANYALYAAL